MVDPTAKASASSAAPTGRILVTGATGTVGHAVVQQLAQQDAPVVAAVRNPARVRQTLSVPAVAFDFHEPATYDHAFRGVEKLFLVRPPAIAAVWQSIFPALRAAQRAGVQHVVFLSLLGAEQNPLVPHRWIEWYLQSLNMDWTFLRPSFFMQNLSTTHQEEIRDRNEIFVPAGEGATSFIDARDIAAVAVRALTEVGHENVAYALTGAEALTYGEVAQTLSDVLGRPIRYRNPSLLNFVQRQIGQKPWGFVLVMAGIYLTARLGLAGRTTDTVRRMLGRPPITMQQFARDYQSVWEPSTDAA
jgi:uncharacterized protein YbjT (DUF2867 family)